MKQIRNCLLISLALSGGSALASDTFEPHPYFGVGYTYVDMEFMGYSADNSMIGAILGYQFHRNFALDFRGYANVSDDDIYGVSIEVERSFSALAKGIIPLNDYVYLYGMFGIAKSKISARYNSISASESDDDVQYGLGMAINKGEGDGERLETQIEWIKLYDKDGFDATGISLNIVYNFD